MKLRLIGDEAAGAPFEAAPAHDAGRNGRGARRLPDGGCVTMSTVEAAIGPLLKELASRYDQVSLELDRHCGDWRLSVSRRGD